MSKKKMIDVRSQYLERKARKNFFVLNSRIKISHLDTNSFTQASKQVNDLFKEMKENIRYWKGALKCDLFINPKSLCLCDIVQ